MRRSKGKIEFDKPRMAMLSVPACFLAMILIGTFFLMLPPATVPGKDTSLLTALFTSTTSVCVTGSIVVDTCVHWSLFGKIVILALIQMGGMGIIAIVSFILFFSERSFSLGESLKLKDMFSLDDTSSINQFFKNAFISIWTLESIGALFYMPLFCQQYGIIRGIWYSFFTSISAFCNAGINIADSNSLENYSSSPMILIVTMTMIILGGLGYPVWIDFKSILSRVRIRRKKSMTSTQLIKTHSRLVLLLTLAFIVIGTVIVLILEYSNPGTIGNMPFGRKVLNSMFQSVTTRTAGFSTFPQENLKESTCLAADVLMFIGGSPLGTSGGVKTVTIFILFKNVMAYLRNDNEVSILKRRIPTEMIRKSTAIVTVQLSILLLFTWMVMVATDFSLSDALYETVSAVSTVGLSRGLTPELNSGGQLLIIAAMFLGRVGPITMLLFFKNSGNNSIHYADGKYIVG